MSKLETLFLPSRVIIVRQTLLRWLLLLALLSAVPFARGDAGDYQFKAAALCNFAEFTDWPPEAFAEPTTPVVIGILGKDPFGHDLEAAVHDKKVNNRRVVVQHFRNVKEIKNCQILFISESETKRLPAMLAGLKERSILTVSDMADFAPRGGMVRLLSAADQIQFQVNLEVLKAARLTMSSKLLRAAEIVPTTKK